MVKGKTIRGEKGLDTKHETEPDTKKVTRRRLESEMSQNQVDMEKMGSGSGWLANLIFFI